MFKLTQTEGDILFYGMRNNKGIAVILVISILAVITSVAAAFLITSRLEVLKAVNFDAGIKASYIAEAGLAHAKALLKEDKSMGGIDSYSEKWYTAFIGSSVDVDGDGVKESKWINLVKDGEIYGRYAVHVTDESGKININTAGYHNDNPVRLTSGYSPFEISLDKFFTSLSCPSPEEMRNDIINFRYNGNYPGAAASSVDDNGNEMFLEYDGLDNDADGLVDEPGEGVNEPAEFVPYNPYGDDRPFFSIFELNRITSVKPCFNKIKNYVTADSVSLNFDKDGKMRADVNYISPLFIMSELSPYLSECGQIAVNIADYRDSDNARSRIATPDKVYYGVEAVRINEVMIALGKSYNAVELINPAGPGGDWVRVGNYYENSNPTLNEFGRGIWTFSNIPEGVYYLYLYGEDNGDIIGDVKVGGVTHLSMKHGEMFKVPVSVGSDGKLEITIYNKEVSRGENFTVKFKSFDLKQEPDGEYIELINISNKEIDLSGWKVDGLRKNDLAGIIPDGVTILPYDYLVLAVDKDDTNPDVPVNIKNNGISFYDIWNSFPVINSKVVQLLFDDEVKSRDDIISNAPRVYNTVIRLTTAEGGEVDSVEYVGNFRANYSIERSDPASVYDSDNDGIFDGWIFSDGLNSREPFGTPTRKNNNLSISGHNIEDILVKNGLFSSPVEICRVHGLSDWSRISIEEIKRAIDRFTTYSYRFEAEGHLENGGGWSLENRPVPYTDWFVSSSDGESGIWLFDENDKFLDGIYTLILSCKSGEAVSLSLKKKDGSWSDPTPPLLPGSDGYLVYGVIDIGGDYEEALPSGRLEIKVINRAAEGIAHFDAVILSPVNKIYGRININTADEAVLSALPVSSEIAADILNNRPYNSVSDLLDGDVLGASSGEKEENLSKIFNLISVNSSVFEIEVTGESFIKGKKKGEKHLRVVVER